MNARQLQSYAIEQALKHQGVIAPELLDYIGGDSTSAIDASIQKAVAASAALAARARQGQIRPHDTDDPAYTANVREAYGDQQIPDVAGMDMETYARYRSRLGVQRPADQGLFAGLRG